MADEWTRHRRIAGAPSHRADEPLDNPNAFDAAHAYRGAGKLPALHRATDASYRTAGCQPIVARFW